MHLLLEPLTKGCVYSTRTLAVTGDIPIWEPIAKLCSDRVQEPAL